jgi:hypothetical protein
MGKWIAGVAGPVAVALLVLYLTRVLEPSLPSYPRLVLGEATATFGTRTEPLNNWEKLTYGDSLLLGSLRPTGKITTFGRGSFTISNEGNSRANLCNPSLDYYTIGAPGDGAGGSL